MAKKILQGLMTMALLTLSIPLALAEDEISSLLEQGKEIAFDRKKGNCLACHVMDDGELPGELGPPLIQMQARYPDKSTLRDQIWDATKRNPRTSMPPFGKHLILTEEEINKIVEYVYTL